MGHLQPHERLEWAETHRKFGNLLFSQGKYKEAMDLYMTCLVALDQRNPSQVLENKTKQTLSQEPETVHAEEDSGLLDEKIKLPVLLNVSACMLKLGMFQKTEKICNLCLETVPSSKRDPKVYFRRGRARTWMGLYEDARNDFQNVLNLLSSSDKDLNEIQNVHRELRKVDQLMDEARKNRARQKKAMHRLLGGETTKTLDDPIIVPLYNSNKTRTFSKLKAQESSTESYEPEQCHTTIHNLNAARNMTWRQYFWMIIASFIKLLLSWLGDDDSL